MFINNNEITFENRTSSTKYGFKHITTLTVNGAKYRASAQYYNRTWEPYPYYTTMCKAASKVDDPAIRADLLQNLRSGCYYPM